jgi:hypothetical protein
MSPSQSLFLIAMLAASGVSAPAAALSLPTEIIIYSEHLSFSRSSTNLTLILSNGVYAAESYTVPAALVSNLVAAAVRPWPKPPTNSWPGFTLDPANLGLDAAWLKSNYQQLLDSYAASPGGIPFPNSSDQQRGQKSWGRKSLWPSLGAVSCH